MTAKNSSHSTVHFGYKEKYVAETENKKFFGLQIDIHHIEEMISKITGACYAVRLMVHISNINTVNQCNMHTFILL